MLHGECLLKAWQPIGKYMPFRKKFRKGMLIGIFTRHNERQLKVMLLHFFLAFQKALHREKNKIIKGEKSTFALDGKMKPFTICYSIV